MKTPISSEAKIVKNLTNLLNRDRIEEIARKTGFITRQRKLSGYSFLLLLILEIRTSKLASLNNLTIDLEKDGILMSKQALHQRFDDSSVEFVKSLSFDLLKSKLDRSELLNSAACFNRIILKDSTVFQLPAEHSMRYKGPGGGASEAGIKIQFEYNLKSNDGLDIDIQSSNTPDIKSKLNRLEAGDLRIEDLGYFKLDRFEKIRKHNAYFLSRLKHSITVFCMNDGEYQRFHLSNMIAQMKPGEKIDTMVYLGLKEKLHVRMILERVPDQVAAQKRRKLKTDKQNKRKNISQDRLAFCDVNAYITNAKQDMLPTDLIRSIYSLRWQIEILFKAWKSIFNIDKVKQMKVQRFECINYGTLLQLILCTKLYNYFKTSLWNKQSIELSELKSLKYLAENLKRILQAILNQVQKAKTLLLEIADVLARKCYKEQKKNTLTPLAIMGEIPLT